MFRMAGYLMAHRSRLLQQVSEKFHKCINYYSTRSVTRVMHAQVYWYLTYKRQYRYNRY